MRGSRLVSIALTVLASWCGTVFAAEPEATKEFTIKEDRAYLDGKPLKLWGIRCANGLSSAAITERHIRNLDNMAAHGINTIGVYIQGGNGGMPNPDAGFNGFTRDGKLKPVLAGRLEELVREADKRGMVVLVGLMSPRKDQAFYDEDAIKTAMEESARFLKERKLKNVFVDLMHEYNNPERIDHALLREPEGEKKKSKLAGWFKAVAPNIPIGICPSQETDTKDTFPGMDVRIIQKAMKIPDKGFVVNVETTRHDTYEVDGIFNKGAVEEMLADCKRYAEAPNAAMLFHAAYIMGITNGSGTAPHPEMGGYGTDATDRGVRFYYEWVRDNVGTWEYPKHVPYKKAEKPKR